MDAQADPSLRFINMPLCHYDLLPFALDWLQSLKQSFINVPYHILVASPTLMAIEPSELDWLQVHVYDMTH